MTQEPVESWKNKLIPEYSNLAVDDGFDSSSGYKMVPAVPYIESLLSYQKQKQIEEFVSMLEESYQDIQHKLASGMAESSFGAEVIWEARMGRIKEFRDDILTKLKEK